MTSTGILPAVRQSSSIRWVLFLLIAGPVCARAQSDKENTDFKLAVNLYNDRMYDLAVEQFKNFVVAYPSSPQGIEARMYLGQAQLKLGQFDDARTTFQNFALTFGGHPRAAEAWMNTGEAFLGLGNLREAASAFERVKVFHSKSPLVPEALLKAGNLYRSIGERDRAKRAFRTILQEYASSSSAIDARLAISEIYADEGQMELAEREARRVVDGDAPAAVKAGALHAIGSMQARASLFDRAEASFRAVLTTYATTPSAILSSYELGMLELGFDQFAQAIDQLSKVAGSSGAPESLRVKAMFAIGDAYQRQGNYPNAQTAYLRIGSTFPGNPLGGRASLEAARAAIARGATKEALDLLNRLRAEQAGSPQRREALALSSVACQKSGQYFEAARFLAAFVNEYHDDPILPEIQYELGTLYRNQLNDCRRAMMIYDQIAQRFPQSPYAVPAMIGEGECLETLGDDAAALATYRRVQALYPAHDRYDSIEQRISLLEIYRIKDRDRGIEKLARLMGNIVTQDSKTSVALQLGMIYFTELKDYEAAAAQLTAAIDAGLDREQFVEAYYHRARALDLASTENPVYADQAILYYDSFLKQFPASAISDDAAYNATVLKMAHRSPEQAIAAGMEYVSRPSAQYREDVLFRLAALQARTNQWKEAAGLYATIARDFPNSPRVGRALLEQGLAWSRLNQLDSAASSWKRAAQQSSLDPATARASWLLASYYWKSNKVTDAVRLSKLISTEFAYSALADSASSVLADGYLALGEFDEAIALYNRQREQQRADPFQRTPLNEVLYRLAVVYEKKGDRERAAAFYHEYLRAHRRGPFASNALYALGVAARTQGKADAASSYFKQASTLGSTSTATRDIADLLFQSEQYADAVKQYTQLLQSPDSASAKQYYQSRIVVANYRMDKVVEAQAAAGEFAKTFGKLKPMLAEFEYERAQFYFRKKDYQNAKKAFENVVSDFKDTPFAARGHFYLGKIAELSSKPDDAAKKYEQVLKENPNSDIVPRALLSLGNMHFNVERYEEAIKLYQQITAMPERAGDILPFAMGNLIEAYEATKLYDAALAMARDYIDRFPTDENIIDKKIKVGNLYTRIGYYDQAVLHFENLLSETGSALEAELRYGIGEAYYYKGDYQQAILEFLRVPYLTQQQGKVNWTATSFYMAGQAYEKMSKFDEAIGMYQQIIERGGIDATFKAAARKEIDRVKMLTRKGSN
jgi:TolA-binding protein